MFHFHKLLPKFLFIAIFLLFPLLIFAREARTQAANEFDALGLTPSGGYSLPKEATTGMAHPAASPANETGLLNNRAASSLFLDAVCTPTELVPGQAALCQLVVQNLTTQPLDVRLTNVVPRQLALTPGSVQGATVHKEKVLQFRGTLAGGTEDQLTIESGPSPAGYVSLASLGIPPLADVGDDTLLNFTTDPYLYNGATYQDLAVTSNGYVIAGVGGANDLSSIPQIFPDPAPPNNVIAPFWTDLNPAAGGSLYAAQVSTDTEAWVVIEWEAVPAFATEELYTFQLWIATNTAVEAINMVYARVDGSGAATGLNIGTENSDGSRGANFGGVPTVGDELLSVVEPGLPGEKHIITYLSTARFTGAWQNCALAKLPILREYTTFCVNGVNAPAP